MRANVCVGYEAAVATATGKTTNSKQTIHNRILSGIPSFSPQQPVSG